MPRRELAISAASLSAPSTASLERYYARRAGRKAPEWRIVTGDARAFDPPDDTSILYFPDPFDGAVFAPVLENIVASLRRAPRQGVLILLPYHDDSHAAYRALFAAGGWTEQPRVSPEFEIHTLAPAEISLSA